jgi:hypothetical protein
MSRSRLRQRIRPGYFPKNSAFFEVLPRFTALRFQSPYIYTSDISPRILPDDALFLNLVKDFSCRRDVEKARPEYEFRRADATSEA